MKILFSLVWLLAAMGVSSCFSVTPAMAAENVDSSIGTEVPEDDTEGVELDESLLQETFPAKPGKRMPVIEGYAGYRFLHIDDYGGRASEYSYLHSGIVGGGTFNRLGQDLKIILDGNYLNEKDYYGDLYFDYAGDYRFHLRTESLFHNTTGEKLFTDTIDLPGVNYIAHQDASLTGYGVRAEQDSANLRYKLHDFPLHVNLGYWRMVKEGLSQLRFADISFERLENNFFARPRSVDRETHEGKIGFDAHLGPVDLIYTFQIRQFTNNADVLRSELADWAIDAVVRRNQGQQVHNQDPDSRYLAHTVKLHTSLAGGLVGAASYTYGRRDNTSEVYDTTGADLNSARLQNIAGDFVYTPFKQISFGLKYRHQDVDNDNPAMISNVFYTDRLLAVRPSIGTDKDIILATLSYRPLNLLTIKGEYKGQFQHRHLTHFGDETLDWFLNEKENTHKGSITLVSRPIKGLRVAARYGYSSTDHPSYGTSPAQKHEGELTSNYNLAAKFGFTASYRNISELNDEIQRRTLTSATPPVSYSMFTPLLAREKTIHNFTTAFWFNPLPGLTVTANYGFLQYGTNQGVMFSITDATGSLVASDYTSESHLYSLSSTYMLAEKADVSLSLQEVHSLSEFKPASATFTGLYGNTSGVTELSRTRTVETSFSARGNYRMTEHLSWAVEYLLQDFYDKYNPGFDGTVHSFAVFVTSKW